MFDIDSFKKALQTQWLGNDFLYFRELDSTNSCLKKIPEEEMSHGKVCLADYQKRGRGQYERNWESSPSRNLTFTLGFVPENSERLHVLTLCCARAAVDLIERTTRLDAYIKWPNDIMINGRKVGGVLTEAMFSGNRLARVVVGIGLNVNQEKFGKEISDIATSLRLETETSFSREQLLADYLGFAEYFYRCWEKNDRDLLKKINQKIEGYGTWIRLSLNGHQNKGKYKLLGINEQGVLTMINRKSEVETFSHEQIRLITD